MLIMSACARLRSAVLNLALVRAALSWRDTSSAMTAASSTAAFTCDEHAHLRYCLFLSPYKQACRSIWRPHAQEGQVAGCCLV